MGLYVETDTSSMLFTLDESYPQAPPGVLLRGVDGAVDVIALEQSQWEPSKSIVQLATALR